MLICNLHKHRWCASMWRRTDEASAAQCSIILATCAAHVTHCDRTDRFVSFIAQKFKEKMVLTLHFHLIDIQQNAVTRHSQACTELEFHRKLSSNRILWKTAFTSWPLHFHYKICWHIPENVSGINACLIHSETLKLFPKYSYRS